MKAIQSFMTTIDAHYKSACLFICLAELVCRFGNPTCAEDFVVTPSQLQDLKDVCQRAKVLSEDFYVLDNQKVLDLMTDYFKTPRIYITNGAGRFQLGFKIVKYLYQGPHFVLKDGNLTIDPLGESNTRLYGWIDSIRTYYID